MLRDYSKKVRLAGLVSALLVLSGCSVMGSSGTADSRAALESVPAGVQKDYRRAVAKLEAGDDVAAAVELERFIERHPDYANAYVNLAIVRDRQADAAAALALLDTAIALDAGNVYALNRRGLILRRQGDFAGAQAAWQQATELQPDYPNAWYNLGVLNDLYLQQLPAALEHYQRYQKLTGSSDGDPTVARWITDLERRIGNPAQAAQAVGDI